MISKFIKEKMKTAKYERIEDGSYFGDIPSIRGIWANAKTLDKCNKELEETLEEWVLMDIQNNENITGFSYKNKFKVPARIKQGHAEKYLA